MRDKPLFISSVIAFVVFLVFIIILFSPLRSVFSPFVTTFVLVYMFSPVVGMLEKWGIKSSLATFFVYGAVLSLGAFALLYGAPKIYTAVLKISDMLSEFAMGEAGQKIQEGFLSGGIGRVYTTVVSATKGTFNIMVSFVAAFYILCDMKNVKKAFGEFIPEKLVVPLKVIGDDIKSSFNSFFRGQLLIAAILFVIDGAFLYAVKIPYSIGLAFIAAVLDIVPYAGAIIAMGLIILVTLISEPGKVIIVAIGLLIIQQIENNIITPKISSDTLSLHPAITVFALYLGAFGGFWGILFAIPLVCVFKRIFLRFIQSIM
ncbi:MAG: AI-2E family transporter [Clostridia bacterium]|nr:AI-2E family transporter [Clostridia bacterium]